MSYLCIKNEIKFLSIADNDNRFKDKKYKLSQGINMFSALAVEFSGMQDVVLKNYLISLNETEMICKKFTRPVKEWFEGWDESVLQDIKKCCFWDIGPLIYVDEIESNYTLTGECLDYLDSEEFDLTSIDEHIVFNLMKQLSQDNYVYIRKFIISHPLLTDIERKKLLLHFNNEQIIMDLVASAYEQTPEETYCCPNCGWTMTFKGLQPECCHRDCVDIPILKEKCEKIEPEYVYRLKIGVMRYICYPGKAEIEIENICNQLNVKSELWPELDRYDIKIIFANGACWGIDAKTYSNPYFLSKSIEKDNYFRSANIDPSFNYDSFMLPLCSLLGKLCANWVNGLIEISNLRINSDDSKWIVCLSEINMHMCEEICVNLKAAALSFYADKKNDDKVKSALDDFLNVINSDELFQYIGQDEVEIIDKDGKIANPYAYNGLCLNIMSKLKGKIIKLDGEDLILNRSARNELMSQVLSAPK